jgi:hypothetical protein
MSWDIAGLGVMPNESDEKRNSDQRFNDAEGKIECSS